MKSSLALSRAPLAALLLSLLSLPAALAEIDTQSNQKIRLPDGRYLQYAEYGRPAGSLVLYFHGTPGSRLEVTMVKDELAEIDKDLADAGVRLISVNRPGIGQSTYQPARRIADWPADVDCLIKALGYDGEAQFGVIALSGGAPYGLAVARTMPQRITHLALVSGHTPPGAPVVRGNSDNAIDLIREHPRVGRFGLNLTDRRLARKPDKVLQKVTKSWTAADRQAVLCDPELTRRLLANLREATQCGTQGLQRDIQLLGSCWGFQVSEAAGAPISIWQGGCDRIVTPSMAYYFQSQLPGSELTIDPQAGHVTMLKWHVRAILKKF